MYRTFYRHILGKYLVGKKIEEYRDKKALNKFHVYDVNFDSREKTYNLDNIQGNTCIVIVKEGIIVSILDVKYDV